MKKLLSVLIAGVMLGGHTLAMPEPIAVFADEEPPFDVQEGVFNGMRYIIYDQKAVITGYTNDLPSDLVIPAAIESFPVLWIDSQAFRDCSLLHSVTVSEGIESLEGYCFFGCSNLSSVSLPDSLQHIGTCSFSNCTNLSAINIPTQITSIFNETFSNCSSLSSIVIPNSVSEIQYSAFSGCSGLTSITISNNVSEIQHGTFSGCSSLTSITIPDSVLKIDSFAFSECKSLKSVVLPPHIAMIHSFTFEDCKSLETIVIPDDVSIIESWAFNDCESLSAIFIPENVMTIEEGAFSSCDLLADVYYGGSEEQWKGITIEGYNTSLKQAEFHPNSDSSVIVAPESIPPEQPEEPQQPVNPTDTPYTPPDVPESDTITLYSFVKDADKGKYPTEYYLPKSYLPERCAFDYLSYTYHPDLAYTLSILSNSAYDKNTLIRNLNNMGFMSSDIYTNDEIYDLTWQEEVFHPDEVGFAIATKKMKQGPLLVMVVIRGTFGEFETVWKGNSEWLSDANILAQEFYGKGRHAGFSIAEEKIKKALIEKLGGIPTDHVRYVITGHSRGAGVANLLEKDILSAGVKSAQLYGYNFACPDVEKGISLKFKDAKYDNIFNIGIAGDPVSMIPGALADMLGNAFFIRPSYSSWGKYGQNFWFSEDWNNASFSFDNHNSYLYVRLMEKQMPLTKAKNYIQCLDALLAGDYSNLSVSIIGIHCPVDSEIVGADGTVLASVQGEEVNYYNDTDVKVIVWTEGDEKFFAVFGNNYTVNLIGTADGEMSADICVRSADTTRSDAIAYYENIPLTAGKQMQLVINDERSEYADKLTVFHADDQTADETINPDIFVPSQLYGDLNLDQELTVSDAVIMTRLTSEDDTLELDKDHAYLSDIDHDGCVTIMDTQILISRLLNRN